MALIKRTELPSSLQSMVQEEESTCKIFLFYGERYLCREAADSVQKCLLGAPAGGSVNVIDGDTEDASKTLGQLMNFSLLPGRQIFRVTDSRLFHSKSVASNIWSKVEQARDAKKEAACRRQLLSFISLGGLTPEDSLVEIDTGQWQTLFGFTKPTGDFSWADELLATETTQKKGAGAGDIAARFVETFKKGIPPNNVLLLTAESVDKRKQLFQLLLPNVRTIIFAYGGRCH